VATALFALVSIFGTVSGRGNTAHLTHIGGLIFAFLYFYLEPILTKKSEEISRRKKIKKQPTVIHYFEPRQSRQEIKAEKDAIDEVLKKISVSGMDSLSEEEYRILEKASGSPIKRDR
jgi:hypothetical protein